MRALVKAAVAMGPDALAYHAFLRTAKQFWATDLYSGLYAEFQDAAGSRDGGFAGPDDAEAAMRDVSLYRFFAWLERHQQRLKYASPRGILAVVEARRDELVEALDAGAREAIAEGELHLDADLAMPDYYVPVEFHQHPGGVWRDALAGVAYDLGRQTTLPAHSDPDEIHRRVAAATPCADVSVLVDLGCGTGRSTLPLATRFPEATVYGIDVSAPCLVRAALRAREVGRRVNWSQQRAEALKHGEESVDLVHSTFLLHELPKKALRDVVREAFRVLRKGGWFVNLDFHSPPGGVWGQFVHYGHARRNDEVFMRSFCETDFLQMQREAGFVLAEMRPFDDGSGIWAANDVPPFWRFPAQLFVARK